MAAIQTQRPLWPPRPIEECHRREYLPMSFTTHALHRSFPSDQSGVLGNTRLLKNGTYALIGSRIGIVFVTGELSLQGEVLDIVGSGCQVFVSIEVREANGARQQFGTDLIRGH